MRNSSAESQTQMSIVYNQSQMNQNLPTNNFSNNIGCIQTQVATGFNEYNNTNNMFNTQNQFQENAHHQNINELSNNNNMNFNMMNSQQNSPFAASNNLCNHTSGGSFTPIYADQNINGNNNQQYQICNTTNNLQQPHQQQFQTVDTPVNQSGNQDSNSMLELLRCIDDMIPLQNSDELRMTIF